MKINIETFTPGKGRILVQRALKEHHGIIYIPDNQQHVTSMFRVIKAGPGCHHAIRKDDIIMAPWNAGMEDYGDNIHLVNSYSVFARFFNGRIFPLGLRHFVKRHVEESKSKGGIIIPEASQEKYQTKDCTVLELGVPDIHERFRINDIKEGDVCRLVDWSETQVEVAYQGHYGLIVHETELLFRYKRLIEDN